MSLSIRNKINTLIRASLCCLFAQGVLAFQLVRADVVEDLLGNQLLCSVVEGERATMPILPLYQVMDGQCQAVVPDSDAGSWFSDNQCESPVSYTRTNMQSYCTAASDRTQLGNGEGVRADTWTLNPGSQLDFGARSLEGVTQPYMQRLVYRQIQTPRGRCDLEMRVYKKHPAATDQRSMLALHGGSWTSRSFGYLGLELTIPHYVDQGFVVYAPFYRLLDDTDSSAACNQADFVDIVDDADNALSWVLDNASQFGSNGLPVVFGQSAGGHLALSLSVNRPTSVAGAVLMYPPTDFADFLQRVQSGAYTNPQGLSILERVVGVSPDQASLSLSLVADNSFPNRIATEGSDWPSVFIVQGSADELVEARQSVRLCEALAGRTLSEVYEEVGMATELRDVIGCGTSGTPSSLLHLIQRGEHALDVCINPNIADLCFSGGSASRSIVSQTIAEAVNFSVRVHDAVSGSESNGESGAGSNIGGVSVSGVSTGGGGVFGWFSVVLLIMQTAFVQVRSYKSAARVCKDTTA